MGQEDAKKEEPETSHYSVLKEAALMVLLLATCANFIGFVATAWVVPVNEESHQHFEGLGLWQFCSFHIEENEALCEKTTSLDMPSKCFDLIFYVFICFYLIINCLALSWDRSLAVLLVSY